MDNFSLLSNFLVTIFDISKTINHATITISSEYKSTYYSTKFGGSSVMEIIKYLTINGIKVTVASCVTALGNAKELSFSEQKKLSQRQSEKYILNILAPKVDKITDLLKLS